MPASLMRWCLVLLSVLTAVAAEPSPGPPEVVTQSEVQPIKRAYHKDLLEGSGATADDASLLLAMQENGLDHKTPNKYRQSIAAALQRIRALDPASLDLPVLALTTTVLAQAHTMAEDPVVWMRAEVFLANLRARWPGEVPRWLGRSGTFGGPETVVLVIQALHACQSTGLVVGDDLATLRVLDLGQGEAADLARAYRLACDGGRPPYIDLATAQRWIDSFDRWWKEGRIELMRMAIIVAYRNGGKEWQLLSDAWRDRLAALRIEGGPDYGKWPLDHHPLGKLYGTAQVLLCQGFLYRPAWTASAKPPPAVSPANPTSDF